MYIYQLRYLSKCHVLSQSQFLYITNIFLESDPPYVKIVPPPLKICLKDYILPHFITTQNSCRTTLLTYSSATYRATNTYYNIFHKTNDPAASFGLFSFLTASVRCDPLGELHSLILPVISTAATNQCHKKIGVTKKRKKKDFYPPKKIL